MQNSLKKKPLLSIAQGFVLILFTFFIVQGVYLYSYLAILDFVNFPLMANYDFISIATPFIATALAFTLPPLFVIGFSSYKFLAKFKLILEVQAFFYLFSTLIFMVYFWYAVNFNTTLTGLTFLYIFAGIGRILICLYIYMSIKMSLAVIKIPLPPNYANLPKSEEDLFESAKYTFFGQNLLPFSKRKKHEADNFIFFQEKNTGDYHTIKGGENLTKEREVEPQKIGLLKLSQKNAIQKIKRFEKKRHRKLIKKAWKNHSLEIPLPVRSSIFFAQTLGFILIILANYPIFNFTYPMFLANYSFLVVFFLYFYLLYLMRKKALLIWVYAYACLILFFILTSIIFEDLFWQVILSVFLICQVFIVSNLYLKGKKWFISSK